MRVSVASARENRRNVKWAVAFDALVEAGELAFGGFEADLQALDFAARWGSARLTHAG